MSPIFATLYHTSLTCVSESPTLGACLCLLISVDPRHWPPRDIVSTGAETTCLLVPLRLVSSVRVRLYDESTKNGGQDEETCGESVRHWTFWSSSFNFSFPFSFGVPETQRLPFLPFTHTDVSNGKAAFLASHREMKYSSERDLPQ